ncbi:MAG: hypothetical protein ACXVKA_04410 [Acidimicrobiia bacterium]
MTFPAIARATGNINQQHQELWGDTGMKKSMVRSGVLLGTLLGTAALVVGPTAAGAAKGKNVQQLNLHCTKLGDIAVVVKGAGTWSAGHVVGSKRVLKPYEIHVTGTFTPTGGSPQPIDENSVKPAPQSRKLDECTFHQEGSDNQGSFSVDGSVKVQYSGKRIP